MSDIISLGQARAGEVLDIHNTSAHAVTYRIGCREAGAVRFTVAPGGCFHYIVGQVDPDINIESVSETGLRPA